MQSLIDMINLPDEENELQCAIENQILELCFDPNGNHVV